jgi:dTDP-4-amino-4,6-dideoxygalactose transaminase
LARTLGWNGEFPLLRFPMLARDQLERDAVVTELWSKGIGASALYGSVLPNVENAPVLETRSDLENARIFADRLVTLPCHSAVTSRDIHAISDVVRRTENVALDSFIT